MSRSTAMGTDHEPTRFVWAIACVVGLLLIFYGVVVWRYRRWNPAWEIQHGDSWQTRALGTGTEALSGAHRPQPSRSSAIERGRGVYYRVGCALCHGIEGRGGLHNPNAQTGGEIVGLQYVAEGFTKAELIHKIQQGVAHIAKKDPSGPEPPLRMPEWRGRLNAQELDDLVAYLFSLMPEEDEW